MVFADRNATRLTPWMICLFLLAQPAGTMKPLEVSAFKTMEKKGHNNKTVMGLANDLRCDLSRDSLETHESWKSRLRLIMSPAMTLNRDY